MTRGRVERVMTQRLPSRSRSPDDVIVEEPLTIRVDGTTVTTTMRTPGNDMELAVGFCVSEGLLAGAELKTVRYCGLGSAMESDFNVVDVDTDGAGPAPTPRLVTTTSACGVCGADSIEALADRLVPVEPIELSLDVIASVTAAASAAQGLFERTGGVHAAVDFDPSTGELGVLREDIGRHNAVDKVVGRRRLDGELPATGRALWVSGRASFEMVQKAWAAGYGALVSVGAPSSLAVSTARRGGLTLAAFARADSATLYI